MNTALGLLGIFGIWLTMAMMPIREYLELSVTQATFLRGLSGVLVIGFMSLFRSRLITWPDWNTVRIALCFVVATLCMFEAVPVWGTNYMALFLDLAVLVPLWFAWRRKQKLGWTTYVALALALLGTLLALRIFEGGVFVLEGFLWSVGALVANGLFIQFAPAATQKDWNKAFWMSAGLVLAGISTLWSDFSSVGSSGDWDLVLVVIFSVATGVFNFYFIFMAFANLSSVSVGVLVLGVTPSIIISSYLMLGKAMGIDQIVGVALTLLAALLFGNALRSKKH